MTFDWPDTPEDEARQSRQRQAEELPDQHFDSVIFLVGWLCGIITGACIAIVAMAMI